MVEWEEMGKGKKEEMKEGMKRVVKKMEGFELRKFEEEVGKVGLKMGEGRGRRGKVKG